MRGIIIRWLVSALSLLLISHLAPGIEVESFYYALIASAALAFLNAFVRPVLILLTLPLTVITLGLFLFVINAVILLMISGIFNGIHIESFWSALLGAIILSAVNWLASSYINDRGRWQYVDLRRGPGGNWS